MESGLEDRNNGPVMAVRTREVEVSMESGLEDRNNRQRRGGLRLDAQSQWSPA